MSGILETLIYVALALNIVGFLIYALSMKKKKTVTAPPQKTVEIIQEIKAEEPVIENPIEEPEVVEIKTEEEAIETEEAEQEIVAEQEEKSEENDRAAKLIEELKKAMEEDSSEEEQEEEIKEEQPKEYEQNFLQELEEQKEEMEKIDEPFDLLEELLKDTPVREEDEAPKIDVNQEFVVGNTPIAPKKERKQPLAPPKREMVDSINILEVEGEDEPEDLYDEIVVQHYEPLLYQNKEEEEIVEEEEEINEEEEIERRIAYLSGEWTDDYIIQPKHKRPKDEK